ncbi:MAG: ATP-binding protein, partial [SAR324 cluster bacterium]|nr:ATP-binding protein [SAR324 cluster bacterium]
MRLSLIGMSAAGKSYWAKRMRSQGCRSIICDNLIAEQLGPLIISSEKSTLGLAAWMGKPDQPGYIEAQAKYLELETKVVTHICDELEQSSESDDKVIIDTTGSLIYL